MSTGFLSEDQKRFAKEVEDQINELMESLSKHKSRDELIEAIKGELHDWVWLAYLSNSLIAHFADGRMSSFRKYYPSDVIQTIEELQEEQYARDMVGN